MAKKKMKKMSKSKNTFLTEERTSALAVMLTILMVVIAVLLLSNYNFIRLPSY